MRSAIEKYCAEHPVSDGLKSRLIEWGDMIETIPAPLNVLYGVQSEGWKEQAILTLTHPDYAIGYGICVDSRQWRLPVCGEIDIQKRFRLYGEIGSSAIPWAKSVAEDIFKRGKLT
jgi:hypothetical protein